MELFLNALGIGRATVLGTNAELVNPCKAGRSQGVIALLGGTVTDFLPFLATRARLFPSGERSGAVVTHRRYMQPPAGRVQSAAAWSGRTNVTDNR